MNKILVLAQCYQDAVRAIPMLRNRKSRFVYVDSEEKVYGIERGMLVIRVEGFACHDRAAEINIQLQNRDAEFIYIKL